MIPNPFYQHPYLTISLISFLVNLPCGYIRENHPKFSFKWFLWIHASIPLIVFLRIALHTSKLFIPAAILLAIAGQVIGSRYRRKTMTPQEREKIEQIPDLRIAPEDRQKLSDAEAAVVLMNMGGPENLNEVRPFLRRLFLDRRIIRVPLSMIFQPIFAQLIVALRWKTAQHRYRLIGGGSPILKSTQGQAEALTAELKKRGRNIFVTLCFNYSRPFADETAQALKNGNKKYILPLSMYPHYSEATTGSSLYYLKNEIRRSFPQASFLDCQPYYLDDDYIQAICDRILEQLKDSESLDDFYVLFSAHGLPLYFLNEGDPYPFQLAQTIAKVIDRLKRKERWAVSYQSAVGPFQWLKPSTESIIRALAKRGIKRLIVVPIAFVNDHIETLCEIDIEYRAFAEKLGIEDFRMSRALECHPLFITALADCVEHSLNNQSVPGYAGAR